MPTVASVESLYKELRAAVASAIPAPMPSDPLNLKAYWAAVNSLKAAAAPSAAAPTAATAPANPCIAKWYAFTANLPTAKRRLMEANDAAVIANSIPIAMIVKSSGRAIFCISFAEADILFNLSLKF